MHRVVGRKLELAIGALNGLVGDYLERNQNGLRIEMAVIAGGERVSLTKQSLAAAYPAASSRVAVLVHGLMCTEDVFQMPDGQSYGSLLARDLGLTPVFVRYNSGLPIAENGAALAKLLGPLVARWPTSVTELILIGYSMGGLVVRSACHVAKLEGLPWLEQVERAIYVGTPHLGAPLERAGRVITRVLRAIPDPVTRLVADIAELRSDGVKDLGDADLRHEDRARRRHGLSLRDPEHPVPLLPGIQHYLAAASLSDDPRLMTIFGDVLVPVPSGTDGACIDGASIALPPSHVRLFPKMSHVALAHHPDVYPAIREWCEA
jgi:triacylglycerol lipase